MLDEDTRLTGTADGRQLAWLRHGVPGGLPVIGLHGMPGGRTSAVPSAEILAELGLDYVTFDRPGYGDSTRRAGRTVADLVDDVLAVADAAGFDSFAVVGGSGGAAHALAVGAAAPARAHSVTLVVPTAPRVGEPSMGDEAWFGGMDEGMAGLHRLACDGEEKLREALVGMLDGQAGVLDGLVDDLVSLHQDWGFDLRSITCPVALWYGVDDVNAPAAQALWLAEQLPQATLVPQDGDHAWPATRMREIFASVSRR